MPAPPTPTRLPLQPARLIGRERELAAALLLLRQSDVRLLTLSGTGGSGKTRLAVEVAQSATQGGAFPDGATFVELAPVSDHAFVPATIAQALGIQDTGRLPLPVQLVAALRTRQLLLVLDNFEHLLPAAPLVADLLSQVPRLKVLVTSRAPLRLRWEHELPVPPLSVPDPDAASPPPLDQLAQFPAVALYLERVRAADPTFRLDRANAASVASICARLDGLPLALELAAARQRSVAPEALLARLTDRFSLLGAGPHTPRDLPKRHQTLRGAIGWSFSLLSDAERTLFRRLAVFAAGWTADAAAAVHGDPDEAARGLDALLEQSLVVWERAPHGSAARDARYRMLDTIHAYAAETLAASREEDAVRWRWAHHHLALARRALPELAGAEQIAWLDRLETERDNFRTVLRWLIERGSGDPADPAAVEVGMELGAALWRLWWVRGYLTEGRRWLAELLALPVPAAVPPGRLDEYLRHRAHALAGDAQLAIWQGEHAAARTALEESLALAARLGDDAARGRALTFLGRVCRNEGDSPAAVGHLEEAVALLAGAGDSLMHGTTLHYLGLALLPVDAGRAQRAFEESAAVFSVAGDRLAGAMPLRGLGLVAAHRGDHAAAGARFEKALQLFRQGGDDWSSAMLLHDLAVLAELEQTAVALSRAAPRYAAALRIWRDLGYARGVGLCLDCLGRIALRAGRAAPAARLAGAAQAMRELAGGTVEPTDLLVPESAVSSAAAEAAEPAAFSEGRRHAAETPDALIAEALSLAGSLAEQTAGVPLASDRPPSPAGLTPRELEVAACLAHALTNRQLAGRLFITEGTAALHVKRILSKLGFHSRAQITVWALARGLSRASDDGPSSPP